MGIFDRDHEPPQSEDADAAYAALRAAIGSVPVLGTLSAELLGQIIVPPLARRQQEWMEDVAATLRKLESQRGVAPAELRDNPVFIDAVLTATQAAIKTSEASKREALRNAILNSALPTAPDKTLQHLFLGFIDRFSGLHLAMLTLFHEPSKWRSKTGERLAPRQLGTAARLLEEAFPDLRTQQELYQQLWLDLHTAGLVKLNTLENAGEGPTVMNKRTTRLGDDFVAFITNPLVP